MGQKINPTACASASSATGPPRWYAGGRPLRRQPGPRISSCAATSEEAVARRAQQDHHRGAPAQNISVTLQTARPGIVIGKKGETSKAAPGAGPHGRPPGARRDRGGCASPSSTPQLVAENIAQQLEKRINVPTRHETRGAERHAASARSASR